jgi:beta-lactamase class A
MGARSWTVFRDVTAGARVASHAMKGGAVELSATVIDVGSGAVLLSQAGDVPRSTASVGKLLLLIEFADRISADRAAGSVLLDRTTVDPVGDSGLWQHLQVEKLPAGDVALLVGAVSDNLATNVLLRHIGLDAVAARAEALGLRTTRLHDGVRDRREPHHPQRLATGTTAELAGLMVMQWNDGAGPGACVLEWISRGADLSMVAHAFGLDPLARGAPTDHGFQVWSKTGTDAGVFADVGLIRRGERTLAYAAVANWDPSDDEEEDGSVRDEALSALRHLGSDLRVVLSGGLRGQPLRFG